MDEDIIKSEIESGIAQVDDTMSLDEFSCSFDSDTRVLSVYFTATSSSGETIAVDTAY